VYNKASKTSGFTEIVEEVGQEFEDDDDEFEKEDLTQTPMIENKNLENQKSSQQKILKYWIKVQKNVLFSYAFLIAPQRGILIEYLDSNSINYEYKNKDKSLVPIKYTLTITVLQYVESLFASVENSLYSRLFIDELVLLFIMIHWISFAKLYNNSLTYKPKTNLSSNVNESQNVSAIMKYNQYIDRTDVNNAALEL